MSGNVYAWPAAEATAPCGDFRWRMKCGLDLLTESLSRFGPTPTLSVQRSLLARKQYNNALADPPPSRIRAFRSITHDARRGNMASKS